MNPVTRRRVEQAIVRRVVLDALAAGYSLTVYDGDDSPVRDSTDRRAILAAMFSVDDEHLIFRKDGRKVGWVYFVYGNDGYDVVSDHTVNLEPVLARANALADRISTSRITILADRR